MLKVTIIPNTKKLWIVIFFSLYNLKVVDKKFLFLFFQAKVTEKFSSSSDESDFEFDVSQAEIPINDANEGSKPIENIGKSVDAPPSRKLKITANRHQVSAPQLQIQQQSTLGQIMTGRLYRQ